MREPRDPRGDPITRIVNGCAWVIAVTVVFLFIIIGYRLFWLPDFTGLTSGRGFIILCLAVLPVALVVAVVMVVRADRWRN